MTFAGGDADKAAEMAAAPVMVPRTHARKKPVQVMPRPSVLQLQTICISIIVELRASVGDGDEPLSASSLFVRSQPDMSMPLQMDAATRYLTSAVLLAALLPGPAVRAESSITGGPDALRVEARDVAVEDVLVGLGASFGLHYRSAASLSRRISGTYEGPLPQVVARLLDGYDFVMRTSASGIEVRVYGVRGADEAVAVRGAVQAAALPTPAQGHSTARGRRDARQKRNAN